MAKITEVEIFKNREIKPDTTSRGFSELDYPIAIDFKEYGRVGARPPLDFSKLSLRLMSGVSRMSLEMHTGGDASFVLYYKHQPAFVMSFRVQESDLRIVQMQGVKQKGYRVNTGMKIAALFADCTEQLIAHPDNTFLNRLVLPHFTQILGMSYTMGDETAFVGRRASAPEKYNQLVALLGMEFNQSINAFVLEASKIKGMV